MGGRTKSDGGVGGGSVPAGVWSRIWTLVGVMVISGTSGVVLVEVGGGSVRTRGWVGVGVLSGGWEVRVVVGVIDGGDFVLVAVGVTEGGAPVPVDVGVAVSGGGWLVGVAVDVGGLL